MSRYDDWQKKSMRLRVGWQKAFLRTRRFFVSCGRWFNENVPWRKLGYFAAGMLVIIIFWGVASRNNSVFNQLKLPLRNQANGKVRSNPEVAALSRLENEVATLKNRLKQFSDSERSNVNPDFSPSKFGRPVLGACGQTMGWIRVGDEWRFHDGVDLAVPAGTNILAAADGIVKSIVSQPALGTVIVLEHGNGWDSRYGHLQGIMVSPGQQISAGTVLGRSASQNCQDAPGCHFSIYLNGEPVDPLGIIPGLGE